MPDYLQLSKFYQFTTRRASKGRCRQPICEFRNNTMATMLKIIHYQRLRVHCFMFRNYRGAERYGKLGVLIYTEPTKKLGVL